MKRLNWPSELQGQNEFLDSDYGQSGFPVFHKICDQQHSHSLKAPRMLNLTVRLGLHCKVSAMHFRTEEQQLQLSRIAKQGTAWLLLN